MGERIGSRLAGRWLHTYTRGVPSPVRERRREEMLSDLHESGRGSGVVRVLLGVPSDVGWWMEQRKDRRQMIGTFRRVPVRTDARRRPGGPRSPGFFYGALTLVLLAIVTSVALSSRQAAPPTIAEFAPQAVGQITHSSEGSAGAASTSGGLTEADEQAEADGVPAATVDVARVRQCVGDPPRQIEDPQSPPCVPYWSGDNGGATWRGVTRDEIRVAHSADPAWSAAMGAFLNKRFELYGRRMHLIRHPRGGDNGPRDRAAARAAYEQVQAFAASSPGDFPWAYYDELARYGIVAAHKSNYLPESYLSRNRPYLWTYTMANDRAFAMGGDWYCARFAGRNAVHAGDPLLHVSRRKPGILLANTDWEGTSAEPLTAQLASCGEHADVIRGEEQSYDPAYYAGFMETAILRMKTSGVTSLFCLCWDVVLGFAMRAATNQGYFPEWLLTSFLHNEATWFHRAYLPHEQQKNLMLLLSTPMHRSYAEHPSNWAIQEGSSLGYPSSSQYQWYADITYWELLLLASGFQMAGPNLTPESFERGLHRTRFPNPRHRIRAGAVGFEDFDHSMTEDAAEMWWSSTERDVYGEAGTYCYVDGGTRRRIGDFPTDDPFFRGGCDNGSS